MSQKLSQEEFERIESYLLNQLPENEKSDFLKELENNSDLKDSVESVKLQMEAIEEFSRIEMMESLYEQMENNSSKVKPLKTPFLKLKPWTVAASVVVLMGIGIVSFWNSGSIEETVYADYFQPDPGLLTPMGDNENYEFYRAMVEYKQGNYETAIKSWKVQLEQKKENDTLNYFLGVALMAQENTEAAIPYLNQVEVYTESAFVPLVFHYRGLAELKEGNIEKAKEYFNKSNTKESIKLLDLLSK